MFGLKICKTLRKDNVHYWPGEYHRLDTLLKPVEGRLRPLWWAVEHAQFNFPADWILEGSIEAGEEWEPLSGPSYQRFEAFFVPGVTPKIARPGFIPAYAPVVSGDWSILYGLPDDPSPHGPLLARLADVGWFASPSEFPSAVTAVIRGIDWAFWEFFFRDAEPVEMIEQHLRDVAGLRVERLTATPTEQDDGE